MNNLLALVLLTGPLNAETLVRFSPNGGCERLVVEQFQKARRSIDVAMYSLNNQAVITAMKAAHGRGVKVRILLDRTQAGVSSTQTLALARSGVSLRLHSHNRIQHNKFAVFDGRSVITGSFNWTEPGELKNEENCLLTDITSVVAAYHKRFENHLWVMNPEQRSKLSLEKLKGRESMRFPASADK